MATIEFRKIVIFALLLFAAAPSRAETEQDLRIRVFQRMPVADRQVLNSANAAASSQRLTGEQAGALLRLGYSYWSRRDYYYAGDLLRSYGQAVRRMGWSQDENYFQAGYYAAVSQRMFLETDRSTWRALTRMPGRTEQMEEMSDYNTIYSTMWMVARKGPANLRASALQECQNAREWLRSRGKSEAECG